MQNIELVILHDDGKIIDIQLEEVVKKLEKENIKINISYHNEKGKKQKIKEKKYVK